MTDERQQRRRLCLVSALLISVTLVAYEPVRHNSFVNYDDDKYITANPDIRSPLTLKSMTAVFIKTDPATANWHPLTTLSHILDYRLFQLRPAGHHFVSVFLHASNAVLLFLLLAKLTGSTWASAFAATAFALHPLQVESVAWAAERKTVLSGFFWLLTAIVYVWYSKRPGLPRYILLFFVYGLCIMTKPVVVTLPFILFLLDYWPLERFGISGFSIKKAVAEKIPLVGLAVFLSAMTFSAQHAGGAVAGFELIPFEARIANIFVSYIRYLCKIIWPSRLAAFYPHPLPALTDTMTVACLLLFAAITFVCLRTGRQKKYVITGWLWFVVTLLPMTGFIQVGSQAMADRYMYISIWGPLVIITWIAKDFIAGKRGNYTAIAASTLVLTLLLISTRFQVSRWKDSLTLWEHALSVTKNNVVAENNYASTLCEQGRINEAESHYRNALQVNPRYGKAILGLGAALSRQKKYSEAAACYNDYLKLGNDPATGYYNLAYALTMQKKYGEALQSLTKALEINPNLPEIDKRMGDLLFRTGKLEDAVEHFNKAIKISPGDAQIYSDLGSVYLLLGKLGKAEETLTKALELAKTARQETLAGEIREKLNLCRTAGSEQKKQ